MHRPRISYLFLSCQAVALRRLVFLLSLIPPFVAFAATKSPIQERADRFLALANAGYQALFRVNSEAQWLAVTDVTPEHDAAAEATAKRTPHSMAMLPMVALYQSLTGVSDSRSQWFIFAAAFMISACTTGIMSAM